MTWLPGELPNDPIWLAKDAEPHAISGERWIDTDMEDDEPEEQLDETAPDSEPSRPTPISSLPSSPSPLPPPSSPSPPPPRPHTPSEQAELRRQGEMLRGMIARLPEPQRIAFFLAKIEDKSLEEISARTGVHEDIVLERVREASRLLTAMLKSEHERSEPAHQSPPVPALPSRAAAPAARLTPNDRLSKRWASLPARTRAVMTVIITVILVVYWGLTAVYIWRNYGQKAALGPASAPPASVK
jgi:DNA-directed RNA polymerase specialized sigma24 family protein